MLRGLCRNKNLQGCFTGFLVIFETREENVTYLGFVSLKDQFQCESFLLTILTQRNIDVNYTCNNGNHFLRGSQFQTNGIRKVADRFMLRMNIYSHILETINFSIFITNLFLYVEVKQLLFCFVRACSKLFKPNYEMLRYN